MGRRQKNERKRKDKRKERRAARHAQPRRKEGGMEVDLRVRHPELARPPVYLDSAGERIADPYACLGLESEPPPTPEAVQAAFRAALAGTSPESEPERARALVQARKFLLEPDEVVGRTLGDLRVPDARHFVPGYESREIPGAPRSEPAAVDWSSRSRLVVLMTLYALLEEELEEDAESRRSGLLFE